MGTLFCLPFDTRPKDVYLNHRIQSWWLFRLSLRQRINYHTVARSGTLKRSSFRQLATPKQNYFLCNLKTTRPYKRRSNFANKGLWSTRFTSLTSRYSPLSLSKALVHDVRHIPRILHNLIFEKWKINDDGEVHRPIVLKVSYSLWCPPFFMGVTKLNLWETPAQSLEPIYSW